MAKSPPSKSGFWRMFGCALALKTTTDAIGILIGGSLIEATTASAALLFVFLLWGVLGPRSAGVALALQLTLSILLQVSSIVLAHDARIWWRLALIPPQAFALWYSVAATKRAYAFHEALKQWNSLVRADEERWRPGGRW
jgi:hypothetical protein